MQQRQKQEKIGQKSIKVNTSRDGDFWEHLVALEAWKRNAEVFRNQGRTGDIDLILYKNGETLLCDVKQKTCDGKSGWYQRQIGLVPDHVYMICVHPITFEISWNSNRIPEGWESFWK